MAAGDGDDSVAAAEVAAGEDAAADCLWAKAANLSRRGGGLDIFPLSFYDDDDEVVWLD